LTNISHLINAGNIRLGEYRKEEHMTGCCGGGCCGD
jgi:hypothetical protein